MGASVGAIVAVIATMNAQIAQLAREADVDFEQHPDAEVVRSLPGLGTILSARVLGEFGDAPNRYADAKSRKNYAGTSPITRASGTKRTVLARYVRNKRLADAIYVWAFASLSASAGARAFYYDEGQTAIPITLPSVHLGNRLVGILHGCLSHHSAYDEGIAWAHRAREPSCAGRLTVGPVGYLTASWLSPAGRRVRHGASGPAGNGRGLASRAAAPSAISSARVSACPPLIRWAAATERMALDRLGRSSPQAANGFAVAAKQSWVLEADVDRSSSSGGRPPPPPAATPTPQRLPLGPLERHVPGEGGAGQPRGGLDQFRLDHPSQGSDLPLGPGARFPGQGCSPPWRRPTCSRGRADPWSTTVGRGGSIRPPGPPSRAASAPCHRGQERRPPSQSRRIGSQEELPGF